MLRGHTRYAIYLDEAAWFEETCAGAVDPLHSAEDGRTLCVVVPVGEALAKQFPAKQEKPDGSPSTMPPHITLLYAKVPAENYEHALKAVEQILRVTRPFSVVFNGRFGSFPNCVYAIPYVPMAERLHLRMLTRLRQLGFEAEQTHLGYKPHATIEYTNEPKKWGGRVPQGKFYATEAQIWDGGDTPILTVPMIS